MGIFLVAWIVWIGRGLLLGHPLARWRALGTTMAILPMFVAWGATAVGVAVLGGICAVGVALGLGAEVVFRRFEGRDRPAWSGAGMELVPLAFTLHAAALGAVLLLGIVSTQDQPLMWGLANPTGPQMLLAITAVVLVSILELLARRKTLALPLMVLAAPLILSVAALVMWTAEPGLCHWAAYFGAVAFVPALVSTFACLLRFGPSAFAILARS